MSISKGLRKFLKIGVVVAAVAVMAFQGVVQEEYEQYKRTAIPVLMYHSVSAVPEGWPKDLCIAPEVFEKHLRYLKEQGYRAVTVPQAMVLLKSRQNVNKTVVITFDDGYENNYSVAYPLLKKYGFAGNFYVVGKFMGHSFTQDGEKEYMTFEQLQEMRMNGMEIGSHTMSHDPLTEIAPHYLPWEIYEPLNLFYEKLGFWLGGLAYPNGAYNGAVLAEIRKYHKFDYALAAKPGCNTEKIVRETPLELHRSGVYDRGRGAGDLERVLLRCYIFGYLETKGLPVSWLERARYAVQRLSSFSK